MTLPNGRNTSGTGSGANSDPSFDRKVLAFAKWSLFGIAFLASLGAAFYVWSGWDNGSAAAKEVFEFVKVGLLPLAVMILTYYFAKPRGAPRGEPQGGAGADTPPEAGASKGGTSTAGAGDTGLGA